MPSESTRANLRRSLPTVEANEAAIVAALAGGFATADALGQDFGQAEASARLLTGMLIGETKTLIDREPLRGLADIADLHQRSGLDGRHYSRFGDHLAAVLRDVLGPQVPDEVLAAWVDAFWMIVGAMKQQERATEHHLVGA